jgi:hypothetical protein
MSNPISKIVSLYISGQSPERLANVGRVRFSDEGMSVSLVLTSLHQFVHILQGNIGLQPFISCYISLLFLPFTVLLLSFIYPPGANGIRQSIRIITGGNILRDAPRGEIINNILYQKIKLTFLQNL